MIDIHVDNLAIGDRIVKLDDKRRVTDTTVLKREVPPIACLGRHFITVDNRLVCYGRGIVTIMNRTR